MKKVLMSIALSAALLGAQSQAVSEEVEAKSLAELIQLVKEGKDLHDSNALRFAGRSLDLVLRHFTTG